MRTIHFPEQPVLGGKLLGCGPVLQLRKRAEEADCEITPWQNRRLQGEMATAPDGREVLLLPRRTNVPQGIVEAAVANSNELRWLAPTRLEIRSLSIAERDQRCRQVRASWTGAFAFRVEQRDGDRILAPGLRPPQVGALHAVLAHWTVGVDPCTVVMPTGTGKTETMLALTVYERIERLLVIVPTAALRDQIGGKFAELGVLGAAGVVNPAALLPVVGKLESRPRTPAEAEEFFRSCNVVVTTMSVLSGCSDEVRDTIVSQCSHLFVDEAHHVPAPSWDSFRELFRAKPIVQFTATPFRNDGKQLEGRVVFNYPLSKAQAEGYFKPINFRPVTVFDRERSDQAIAAAAVEQLERDRQAGFEHLVMARTADIGRAKRVFEIYERIAAAYRPVLLHSELPVQERREGLRRLRGGEARIVVCVDMLGEGFDLPELKIAALHDVHKSLAITLQFTGRFTRTTERIGEATVIANVAAPGVEEALRGLYAEDADWNQILRNLAEGATARQARNSEFLTGFHAPLPQISLRNIFPKMSTVVYQARRGTWRPDAVTSLVRPPRLYAGPTINRRERVLLFITRELEPVPWGDVREVRNTLWDLYLVHWDPDRRLLFINSSNTSGPHQELAHALVGDDAELIRGERVFRCLYGINRLMLMNLGLSHSLSRAVRFTMFAGYDIRQGLGEAKTQNKIKSNLFGRGFENGETASIGCSQKGRIWSYRIAYELSDWVDWCRVVGGKLIDDTISVEAVFRNLILPRQVDQRPEDVPIVIEWSEDLLRRSEDVVEFDIAGEVVSFLDVGLEIVAPAAQGPIRFRVFGPTNSVDYEVSFESGGVVYRPTGEAQAQIRFSRRHLDLSEWLQQEPPVIRFSDGTFLIYNELFEIPRGQREPYPRDEIEVWDWQGTDIRKESQTYLKDTSSVQHRVIREITGKTWPWVYDLVLDDDDTNEAADVVAVRVDGDRLVVHLFHCKYSKGDEPSARVEDLYEVCGQAQRSVHRKSDPLALLDHLRLRSGRRETRHGVSRFEVGDYPVLERVRSQARYLIPDFKIFIVQPGLSRAAARADHLELLAATQSYLLETYAIPMTVIASP